MPATDRIRSATIIIEADPATVFDVLADARQHSLFDGSGNVKNSISGPPRLYLGATFSMRMSRGAPYLVRNRVVEWEEDRLIAWRHFMRHVWRYQLAEVEGKNGPATQVTESFDWAPAPLGFSYDRMGIPEDNARNIEATLQRLKVLVESRIKTF